MEWVLSDVVNSKTCMIRTSSLIRDTLGKGTAWPSIWRGYVQSKESCKSEDGKPNWIADDRWRYAQGLGGRVRGGDEMQEGR